MPDLSKLSAPFPPDKIEWRVGSTTKDKARGMALAYIDARSVQDRLDEVCGAFWQCRHEVGPDGKKTTCHIGIKVGDEWIWRSDGAGETDFESEKGGYSDSFKRAAVKWGIGRYLYDLDSPWVALKDGKYIQESELTKLRGVLAQKAGENRGNPVLTRQLAESVVAEGEGKSGRKPVAAEYANDKDFAPFIKEIGGQKFWKTTAITGTNESPGLLRQFLHDLEGVTDIEELDGLEYDNRALLMACQIAVRSWYYGKPGSDVPGIQKRIDDKRRELEAKASQFNPNRILMG